MNRVTYNDMIKNKVLDEWLDFQEFEEKVKQTVEELGDYDLERYEEND